MTTRGLNGLSTMRIPLYTVYTLFLYTVLLSGCSSSGSLYTMANNSLYMSKCMGPNAPHRPGDDECRYWNSPAPQYGTVSKFTQPDWSRPDAISYCARTGDSGCGKPVRNPVLRSE